MTPDPLHRDTRRFLSMSTIPHQTEHAPPREPQSHSIGATAETPWSLADAEQTVVEIRDPEIDVPDIMRRIRHNMAVRQKLPPLAAALGRARMEEERDTLRKAILDLQERIDDFGIVETHQGGWLAWIDLGVKMLLRKLINRHLHQQQLVHERLLLVLDRLVGYLDEQDQCFRSCLDQAERQSP